MAGIAIAKLFDTIYNAIDNGKFELAEELCSKPEVSKYILGKALLSYCYASLRKNSKAMELAKVVMATKPTEDGILNALGCTFKTLRAEKEFCECYENAMRIKEMGEPYSLELFYSYGRQFEPKKMQQIAQKLYKTVTDKPYYLFWSVGCMLHQDDLPPTMLVVAQKMMHKAFYELFPNKQPSAEELSLYLYILVKQGLNEEALSALRDLSSRPVSTFINDGDHFESNVNLVQMHKLTLNMHRIDILVRMKQLHAVVKECKDILESYPDQWNIHTLLVDCLIRIYLQQLRLKQGGTDDEDEDQLRPNTSAVAGHFAFPRQYYDVSDVSPSDNEEGIDQPIEILTTHQQFLRSIQQQCPKMRGPYLAEMHLLTAYVRCCQEQQQQKEEVALPAGWLSSSEHFVTAPEGVAKSLVNLLVEYVGRFQTKPTCFTDIKSYIHTLRALSVGPASNNEALKYLRDWSHSEKQTLRFLLQQSAPTAAAAAAAGDNSEVAALSSATLVDDKDDEGEDEEESCAAAGTTTAATAAAGGGSAASKKNKKKKGKKKSTAATAASAAVAPTPATESKGPPAVPVISTENDLVILHLCSYSKHDQVEMYCSLLLSGSELPADSEQIERSSRLSLYDTTKGLFSEGVNGEKRNVLPGDELLLVNSASHRLEYAKAVSERATESKRFVAALRWAAGLTHGVESSPYSFGYKLELLEPLRELTIGEASVVTYNGLGAKHIQYDTMSYLFLPGLVEAGLYQEALRHNRLIVNFHTISKRETQDMLSHSFDFANYVKGLELKQFIDKCQRSTQLAVTRAEVPLLELTGKYHSAVEAANYLQGVEAKEVAESQRLLSPEELHQLVDNMDYDLLVRPDLIGEAEGRRAARLRRLQLERRINIAQCSSRLVLNVLMGNSAQCQALLRQIILSVNQHLVVEEEGDHAKAGAAAKKDVDAYLQWDQRTLADRGQKFESLLWKVIESSVMFGLSCKQTNTTTDTLLAALKNLFDLREHLLDANNRYLSGNTSSSAAEAQFLSPDWLRSVSYFLRTMVVWCPLQLQTTLVSLQFEPWPATEHPVISSSSSNTSSTASASSDAANKKKQKGKKQGNTAGTSSDESGALPNDVVVTASALRWGSFTECISHINSLPYQTCSPGESMKLFAEAFFDLMEQLYSILGAHFNHLNRIDTAVAVQVLKSFDATIPDNEDTSSWEPVVDQLISSHKMSCERFREHLKIRMDVLRVVLCKKIN